MSLWHIWISFDGPRADTGNTDQFALSNQLPLSLWAKSPTDAGKIHNALPIKIQINPLKPLPRISQYPTRKEALQGIKSTIEDDKKQGLITTSLSPCDTTILPVRNLRAKGKGLTRTSEQ